MQHKYCQFGSSMVEMLGVLSIIGVLSISTIKIVSNVIDVLKQNLVVTQLRSLQKNISERYNLEGDYQTLLASKTSAQVAEVLCTQKLAPNEMCFSSAGQYRLQHRMNGEVIVESESDAFPDEDTNYERYVIYVGGLSDRTCINAAQINWNSKQKIVLYRMAINAGTDKQLIYDQPYNNQTGDNQTFPVDVGKLLSTCKNDGDNSIVWVFY